MEVVLNEYEANREVWGPAALEQRRERTRKHLASIASAARAGLSATDTIMNC